MRSSPAPSPRGLRVGEMIRHALAETLMRGEIHDPVFDGVLVTVAEVKMSPDLKLATAYVAPLAGKDADAILEAFERNRRFLRGVIAKRVNLRYAPDLRFRLDESFAEGERIDALLRQPAVRRDLKRDEDAEDGQ
ncbi:MAG: 30S ribosome-binding factor RbfA [Bauldia sp.]